MMDCRKTQELLTAYHDGELAGADRARVERHLRECPECRGLLADMARADAAAGVPEPGPGYWDRFNARVADRIAREEERPGAAVLRPKRGWMRQQLRYFIPAAAAAALVVVVVRYAGRGPVAPAPTPPRAEAVKERPAPDVAGQRMAKTEIEHPAAKTTGSAAAPGRPAAEPDRAAAAPEARVADAAREERDRRSDGPQPEGKDRSFQDRAAAPAALGETATSEEKLKKTADAAPPVAEPPHAAKAESTARMGKAKEQVAREAASAASVERAGAQAIRAPSHPAAARATASPCEAAQALAAQGLYRKAEAAQRECLARDASPPAQERGLVFLAELLDRQARYAEADAVIADVHRQFPKSLRLDQYRQQRPMLQQEQAPVPAAR